MRKHLITDPVLTGVAGTVLGEWFHTVTVHLFPLWFNIKCTVRAIRASALSVQSALSAVLPRESVWSGHIQPLAFLQWKNRFISTR